VTGQPRHPLIQWATAPFRALRYLNQELLATGEAMARSNRFPPPRPQAGPVGAEHTQPAPASNAHIRSEETEPAAQRDKRRPETAGLTV